MTGVHIAYWFAQHNKTLKRTGVGSHDGDEKDEGPKAPPQLLYCGPSNKSVDVVAGKSRVSCIYLSIHLPRACLSVHLFLSFSKLKALFFFLIDN